MDKSEILEHLVLARKHVARALSVVSNQQQLVSHLERDQHDTALARQLLSEFEHTLNLYREDVARLEQELAAAEAENRKPFSRL